MIFPPSEEELTALSLSTELVETEMGTGVLLALLQPLIASAKRQIETSGVKTTEQRPRFFLSFFIFPLSPYGHISAK